MKLEDLADIVEDAVDELEKVFCPNCDICIDLGHDKFRYVDKIQLRFDSGHSHAILVFGCKDYK